MLSPSTLAIALIVIYLIVIQIVSYFAHRSSEETVEDFFIASRSTGIIALVGTMAATKINGLALTTAPAFIYEGGILYSQTFLNLTIASLLSVYFGPLIWQVCQRKQFITQAELYADYYKSPLIYGLTTIIGIISTFPFLVVQFAAVGKIFAAATGNLVTYEQSVIILAIFTGIYVFLGGAKAVIWTDVVQGFVFMMLLLVSTGLFMVWGGGLVQGWQTLTQVMPEKLVFNSNNTRVFIEQSFSWSFAYFTWPHIFQRVMMGRSGKIVAQASWGNFGIGFVVKIALLIMGIMGTATLYGQINDSDQLVAEMFSLNFPLGGSIIILAVFACGMSSIDSVLLSVASIFTRDVVEKIFPQPMTENSRYRLAQIVSLVVLVLAVMLTLSDFSRGYLAPVVTLGATLATLLLWPLLGMFVWQDSTKEGTIAAMGLGLVTLLGTNIWENSQNLLLPVGSTTITFFVSGFAFIFVSFLTRNTTQNSQGKSLS